MKLGPDDAVLTVATDGGAEMYGAELNKTTGDVFGGAFDDVAAAEVFGHYLLAMTTDNMLEMSRYDRERHCQTN